MDVSSEKKPKERKGKPQGRKLINLDGSPYATRFLPKHFRLAARLATSPPYLVGTAITFAAAAHEMCTRKHSVVGAVFIGIGYAFAPIVFGYINKIVPWEKTPAIDKSGYVGAGAEKTLTATQAFFTVGAGQGAAGLLHIPFIFLAPTVFQPIYVSLVAATLSQAAWNICAAAKLHKGDWTIITDPPRKPAKEKKGFLTGRLANLTR